MSALSEAGFEIAAAPTVTDATTRLTTGGIRVAIDWSKGGRGFGALSR